ncbi:alkaline phosphatase family protein [Polaribacter sp. Z022]|uniref:LTA synthase family protein n=1 Tax=Polaribacter sp. Z022 TaxID=2927125 RepID=UPI00201FD0D4|nr:alkaline phosphatase family protein [Polaribacter sp. Z022]MCL7752934.1 sulfatase-like hydrolase/transferase [Polaribacter sp. Z022]
MKTFKNRLLFNLSYFFLWIAYFVFARLFFLLFNYSETKELSFLTTLKTFLYGLQLDLAFAAYLAFIPFLLIIGSVFVNAKKIGTFIKWYSYLLIIFINLLLLIDAGLYQSWGVRLDTSILPYLNTPELMIASVSSFQLISGILFWLLITFIIIKLFKRVINNKIENISTSFWLQAPVFLIIAASLIIPIRGGFQTIPVNQSNVYFSNKMYANHASINFIWNFFNTLTHKTDGKNPYKYFDTETANNIINKTKDKLLEANTDSILNIKKPNVILIIWEGLTAKVVGSLGGEPLVTPNINKLSKESILFTNFYANGDRTDKGLPAILSGYYPPPIKRIMRMPNKTRSLPMLPQKMINLGYNTSFYYGGDLNFGNMNTYLRNAGINNFIDGSEFDKDDWNSKWGAHDHIFLERFAKDLQNNQQEPFFKIALTLSSHEPYQFPDEYKFGKDSEDNKFRSSHYYTDKSIGKFIDFAKKQSWYKNTIIVIMADHGHSSPKHEGPYNNSKRFKIPMLWLGGAIQKPGLKINNFSSQVDFSYTLLDLLGGENKDFVFSKNIFNTSDNQYAHYLFNKGFGTITKNGFFLYDYVSKKPILIEGKQTSKLDSLGKAISQNAFQDFLNRK